MSVTLTQILDPAQGADQFNTPDNGNRFVGAKFKIDGISGSFSGNANNDVVLIGSNSQRYQPDSNNIVATNFNAGKFNLSPDTSAVGWVVFQVPLDVEVQSIQWGGGDRGGQKQAGALAAILRRGHARTPHAGLGGSCPATWTP